MPSKGAAGRNMMGRYHLQERGTEYFRHVDLHLKKQKQNND